MLLSNEKNIFKMLYKYLYVATNFKIHGMVISKNLKNCYFIVSPFLAQKFLPISVTHSTLQT